MENHFWDGGGQNGFLKPQVSKNQSLDAKFGRFGANLPAFEKEVSKNWKSLDKVISIPVMRSTVPGAVPVLSPFGIVGASHSN